MIQTVLVGADASGPADLAVQAAADLARVCRASLVVVYVKPLLDPGEVFDPDASPEPATYLEEIGQRFSDLEVSTALVVGEPAARICDVAEKEKADVIVIGGRGAHSKQRRLVRNVTRAFHVLQTFYSRPVGWLALFVTSGILSYAGGGVFFWFHALYRGERGPAINPWFHWMLDSSLGFLGLTPVLFLILPLALWMLGQARGRSVHGKTVRYVILVGVLFAVVTGPGPLLHDILVGHGTLIARWAQGFFGFDHAVAARHVMEHSLLSESLLQVALGLPVYIALACLGVLVIRAISRVDARLR